MSLHDLTAKDCDTLIEVIDDLTHISQTLGEMFPKEWSLAFGPIDVARAFRSTRAQIIIARYEAEHREER